MSNRLFWTLLAAAIVVGLAFRLARLDARPMHHDEANQAVRFGALLETAHYRYDPNDHHGPTLYYLTLPAAWLRGQRSLAALDERTLRLVPALFGAGTILLFALFARGLGRTAVAAAALLAAVSPALTYYSRFYIQESLLVFFAVGFLFALGRWTLRPGAGWALAAGVFAGLAYATKETSVIVFATGILACALARAGVRNNSGRYFSGGAPQAPVSQADGRSGALGAHVAATGSTARTSDPNAGLGPPQDSGGDFRWGDRPGVASQAMQLAAGLLAALAVAFLFYSSLFDNPSGFLESIRAFTIYVDRGVGNGSHVQPWNYYLRTLAFPSSGGLVFTEVLVLVLALAGLVAAFSRHRTSFWLRYLAAYSVVTAVVFSTIHYKTPWNLLPFYVGFVLMAGVGLSALLDLAASARRRAGAGHRTTALGARLLSPLVVLLFLAASVQLAAQNWRASVRYAADPRNPYVYAHTVPDFLRLVSRVRDLSAVHLDGRDMLVTVIAGPYEQWPLPWYLRGMTRVGYWASNDLRPISSEGGLRARREEGTRTGQAIPLDAAPVVIASQESADSVAASLGDRYVSEFYGLRPDVLLTLYIDRALWERFLESRR